MKKTTLIIATLLLSLCLLPVSGLAENLVMGDIDGEVIDLGAFSLTIGNGDICEVKSEERVNGDVWMVFYPAYDFNTALHSNMNVIWMDGSVLAQLPKDAAGMEDFALTTANNSAAQVAQMGVPCTVISAAALDNIVLNDIEFRSTRHVSEWDYTDLTQGAVGKTQLTTTQLFADFSDGGYIITLTTYTDADLELLMNLLSTIAPTV